MKVLLFEKCAADRWNQRSGGFSIWSARIVKDGVDVVPIDYMAALVNR